MLEGGLKPISARIGGKVLLKKTLVDKYFPASSTYKTYVEPFVGGGSIYFYKNKDGHKEVVNDLDPSIYELFKGFQKYASLKLADEVNGNYTEEDFKDIKESEPKDDYRKFLKTYLLYKLSYFGKGEAFGKPRISTSFTPYKERLENVDILNQDYEEVIKKYDSPSTFFYLDPPTRAQTGKFNFPSIDQEELSKICKNIKGKFLLSLGDKPNKELFKGYNIVDVPTKYVQGRSKGGQSLETSEYLIMNYKTSEMTGGDYVEPNHIYLSGKYEGFRCNGKGHIFDILESKNIEPIKYLKIAKKKAKDNGYNPDKLHFSCNGKHKLYYDKDDNKEGCIFFGDKDYNDYIIYTLTKNTNADKYRDAYLARATKIPGDWEKDKYSPNNMAIKILW